MAQRLRYTVRKGREFLTALHETLFLHHFSGLEVMG
jgi:hypothetical protein